MTLYFTKKALSCWSNAIILDPAVRIFTFQVSSLLATPKFWIASHGWCKSDGINETFLFWMEYFYFHIFSTFSFFLNRKFVEGVRLQLEHGPGKRWLQLEHLPNKSCANILIVHQHGFCKHESNHLKYNVTGKNTHKMELWNLLVFDLIGSSVTSTKWFLVYEKITIWN